LAILEEAENVDVNEVCAKYEISAQTYRVWRYKSLRNQTKEALLPREEAQDF
jgi:hypothetical protein